MPLVTGYGHVLDQDRAGSNVATKVNIVADRDDGFKHVFQVARNGNFFHGILNLAMFDPKARGTA